MAMLNLVTRLLLAFLLAVTIAVALVAKPARASDDFASWPLLTPEFPSTGGGGVIIKGYNPVIADGRCATDFTAHLPDGQVFANTVEFEAVPTAGGIICQNGRWRAKDGSATGTTPLRVFAKDGVMRRSP
jgi:hypothetical protein